MRLAMRAPIFLYKARLGFLLGQRFLLLTHTGRKSGLPRHAVLEVVDHDRDTDTYVIASGWGEKSDWLQNIQKTPRVTVNVGSRRFETDARRLSIDEAARALGAYAIRHPIAFRQLSRFMVGEKLGASPEDVRKLAERIPLVALAVPTSP
jgi:deazaflavin-dependent oxidoreductase (nitroreductase family)